MFFLKNRSSSFKYIISSKFELQITIKKTVFIYLLDFWLQYYSRGTLF